MPSRISFLLSVFTLLMAASADAQLDLHSYRLDTFHLPLLKRNTLELQGDFSGSYTGINQIQKNHETTSSRWVPDLDLAYTRFVNRPQLQSSISVIALPDFAFYRTSNSTSHTENKQRYIQPSITATGFKRFYKQNFFLEAGLSQSISYNAHTELVDQQGVLHRNKDWTYSSSTTIPVGFGWGRLEVVSDLSMALFLLQDAIDSGVDPTTLNPIAIDSFARLIAQLNNERIFDARLKRKHELKMLYGMMQQQGWIVRDDPSFFTVLTDNWIYNEQVFRQAGSRWRFIFEPGYNRVKSETGTGNTMYFGILNRVLNASLSGSFEKYVPENLHVDHWRIHTMSYGLRFVNDEHDIKDILTKSWIGNLITTYGWGWYPNSRTVLRSEVNLEYEFLKQERDEKFKPLQDKHTLTAKLNANADYFVSYKTRIVGFADLSYGYSSGAYEFIETGQSKPGETTMVRFNCGAKLIVAIF